MPLDFADIEKEVLAGLPNEQAGRLAQARDNQNYAEGNFDADTQQWKMDRESIRTSLVMQRVVRVLTGNLYRRSPTRALPDHPEASDWLNAVYKRHRVDALWKAADALAVVNECAAFRVLGRTGAGSAESPVAITLWGADQLAVWLDPDDVLTPAAVATIEMYDCRRRLTLYTPDLIRTYLTDKWAGQTTGATAYQASGPATANPYGVIPFSFVHFDTPSTCFWSGSPGTYLQKLNYFINYRLSDQADNVSHTRPLPVVTGASADWNFPRDRRPGQWTTIPGVVSAGEQISEGRAEYIHCDLGFLAEDWDDLNKYMDHALEMVGVPPSTIRMGQVSTMSGVALMAEQIPIVQWAEGRQDAFAAYEDSLARLVLTVGAKHATQNKRSALAGAPVAALAKAADDPGLVVRWPNLMPRVPTAGDETAEVADLTNGLISRTMIVMDRNDLSREDAEAYLEEVAEDLAREAALLGTNVAPAAPGAGGAAPAEGEKQADDGDMTENEAGETKPDAKQQPEDD
jgi:hypothetical protein